MCEHVQQRRENLTRRITGLKNRMFLGKPGVVDKFLSLEAIEFNPDIVPGVITVSTVMDDIVRLNKESLARHQLIAGRVISCAGPVDPSAGEDTMNQIMAAYGRPKGVVRLALLPPVLIDGDVKIVIAQKEIVLHGNPPE